MNGVKWKQTMLCTYISSYDELRNLVTYCLYRVIYERHRVLQVSADHINRWRWLIDDDVPPSWWNKHIEEHSGNRYLLAVWTNAAFPHETVQENSNEAMLLNSCIPKPDWSWQSTRSNKCICSYWLETAEMNWLLHTSLSVIFVLLLPNSIPAPHSLIL